MRFSDEEASNVAKASSSLLLPRSFMFGMAYCGTLSRSFVRATHGDMHVRSVGCDISTDTRNDFRKCINSNFCEPTRKGSPFMKQKLKCAARYHSVTRGREPV
jgi:hypothetical protein